MLYVQHVLTGMVSSNASLEAETAKKHTTSILKCFDHLRDQNVAKRAKFGTSLIKDLTANVAEVRLARVCFKC